MWLDEYERAARLAPGLIALLPIPLLVTAFGLKRDPVVAILLSLLIAVGGPLVLAKYVRWRGRALETVLYQRWGGPPTTLLLTPAGGGAIDAVREQRRANVERVTQQVLPRTPLPNDDSAQQIYKAATSTLRQKTYSHSDFPLVFAENKSFGFERNLRAIRPQGIAIAAAGFVASAVGWILTVVDKFAASSIALLSAAIVMIFLAVFWICWPTEDRVRQSADLYAEQLLDAAAKL